jgi:hypothetical protein
MTNVCTAWLHAIRMEIKNFIDHCTFVLGKVPHKNKLIIPVKLVLKAKQTATDKLEKLKARVVAHGDLKKCCINNTKAPSNSMSFSYAKTLLKPLLMTNPTSNRLTNLKLLKTPRLPAHRQEGSNSSSPPLVKHAAHLKRLTSSVPTFKPKSLVATS